MPEAAQAPRPATHAAPRVAHTPEQYVCPAGQTTRHTPAVQDSAALHATPHAPQFRLSSLVLTSQPLAAPRSQSAKPAAHANPQPPAAHVAVALAADAQAVDVCPSPSALHVRRDAPSQSTAPGVHTHGAQTPARHVCRAPQSSVAYARPSALQARRCVGEVHEASPGMHSHALQDPAPHVEADGHGEVVAPRPSALHTSTVRASAQRVARGVHIQGRHRPPLQVCMAAQAVIVYPRPSALHAWRVEGSTQVAVPGAQRCATQDPPLQLWPVPHDAVV